MPVLISIPHLSYFFSLFSPLTCTVFCLSGSATDCLHRVPAWVPFFCNVLLFSFHIWPIFPYPHIPPSPIFCLSSSPPSFTWAKPQFFLKVSHGKLLLILFIFVDLLAMRIVTAAKLQQCFYNFEMFIWFLPSFTPEELTQESPVYFIILINLCSSAMGFINAIVNCLQYAIKNHRGGGD